MRWKWPLLLIVALLARQSFSAEFPDTRDPVPPDWKGPIFHLSQKYPTESPKTEDFPWSQYSPKTKPEEYIRAVFKYALEGNVEVDWAGEHNSVRRWFHAPWLHWGRYGREFVHGLTYERVSQPGELAPSQTQAFQNWAVGMYNYQGGYTIGQVWRDPNAPDPKQAIFPEGTVGVKLLFTQATVAQVPYLIGAKEWEANIYQAISVPTNPFTPKSTQTLRLLQIDVVVKDKRVADTTGWVFGTFVYNGLLSGGNVWDKFVPVGLMWGNDPMLTISAARSGKRVEEGWINPSRDVPYQHLGYAGRLNGPVDNVVSSCLSCHGVAQSPASASLIPPPWVLFDSGEYMRWFRNIRPPQPFCVDSVSLDYSLQLTSGIANFNEWEEIVRSLGGADTTPAEECTFKSMGGHPAITRSGNFE